MKGETYCVLELERGGSVDIKEGVGKVDVVVDVCFDFKG